MTGTILITGSEGLIGRALAASLFWSGFGVRPYDLKLTHCGRPLDVLEPALLTDAAEGCVGIVHLAAVSRVIWGQREPDLCWRTNVEGTRNALRTARQARLRPWVLLASSREVYGQAAVLPVSEDTPLDPVNVYGRSKAAAEALCIGARSRGVQTAIARLSNVYGSTGDHADRVVPCFAARAALGLPLSIEGREHTFDFTHLTDTVRGLLAMIRVLTDGEQALPPIHLLTGKPTTLGQLALLASAAAGNRSPIVEAPPRHFDVARFVGNPSRAKELLGFSAEVELRDGVSQLVREFAALNQPLRSSSGELPTERA